MVLLCQYRSVRFLLPQVPSGGIGGTAGEVRGSEAGVAHEQEVLEQCVFQLRCTGRHYPGTGGTLLSAGCGEPAEERQGALYSHTLSIKVEHLEDCLLVCRLVEADVAHFFQ